jgi:hypothetical protein
VRSKLNVNAQLQQRLVYHQAKLDGKLLPRIDWTRINNLKELVEA